MPGWATFRHSVGLARCFDDKGITHSRASSVVRTAGCLDSQPACSEGMVHLASGQGRKRIRWSRSSILWTNYGKSTRLIPSQENLSRTGSLGVPLVCQSPSSGGDPGGPTGIRRPGGCGARLFPSGFLELGYVLTTDDNGQPTASRSNPQSPCRA